MTLKTFLEISSGVIQIEQIQPRGQPEPIQIRVVEWPDAEIIRRLGDLLEAEVIGFRPMVFLEHSRDYVPVTVVYVQPAKTKSHYKAFLGATEGLFLMIQCLIDSEGKMDSMAVFERLRGIQAHVVKLCQIYELENES